MDTITKLGTTFASFVICQLLFHFVSSWFSAKVFPRFNSLSLEVKIAWNLRVVSTCHYLVIAVFCLYILLSDGAHIADPLGFDPSLVNVHIAITTGYLISDLLLHIFCWRMIGEIVYVIYRCAVLYIFCLLLFFFQNEATLAYVGNFRLITELDIPFWNQQWFFETLMYSQSSEVFIINAVLLTVMFFLGRIAVIPAFYYCMYYVYGNVVYTGLELLIPCSLASGLVVLQIEEIWIPSLKNEALFLPALSSVTFFSTLVVSTCHSLVVGVFCLYILLSDGALIADPLGFDPSLVNVNIAITAGYVISALLLRIFCWRAIVFFPEWSNTGIHLEFSSDKTACLFMNQWVVSTCHSLVIAVFAYIFYYLLELL
ncbi:transmembrane protein 56-like isoform X2 [Trichechus manatus latirostris]|uniref:Transmembrane protein 56-like isoform X2 n=1 Tax=Trichechus manatus latirostris TaxID=127582 RepID=A0A2Y9RBF0_TRIMA|nr:transmembrane protein 56-like isoform X2 [Trichechus manatus latirostris]